jgi:hypothetical protein
MATRRLRTEAKYARGQAKRDREEGAPADELVASDGMIGENKKTITDARNLLCFSSSIRERGVPRKETHRMRQSPQHD